VDTRILPPEHLVIFVVRQNLAMILQLFMRSATIMFSLTLITDFQAMLCFNQEGLMVEVFLIVLPI
jgi:hypothetical protein